MLTSPIYINVIPGSRLLRTMDAERIARALRAGELAVLPTETGYMLAAAVSQPQALEAAFAAKRRDRGNTMHIACSSLEMARQYAVIDDQAARLIGAFTPGPLSVIVPQTGKLPAGLVTRHGTVGIRIPDHPATLQVVATAAVPLTATSLNVSGMAEVGLDNIEKLDWPEGVAVYVAVDPVAVTHSKPSTLVRLTGGPLEVLRPGPVPEEDLISFLSAQ